MLTGLIVCYFGFGRTVLLVCPFVNTYKLLRWGWNLVKNDNTESNVIQLSDYRTRANCNRKHSRKHVSGL